MASMDKIGRKLTGHRRLTGTAPLFMTLLTPRKVLIFQPNQGDLSKESWETVRRLAFVLLQEYCVVRYEVHR
jgi:hypothetical protein